MSFHKSNTNLKKSINQKTGYGTQTDDAEEKDAFQESINSLIFIIRKLSALISLANHTFEANQSSDEANLSNSILETRALLDKETIIFVLKPKVQSMDNYPELKTEFASLLKQTDDAFNRSNDRFAVVKKFLVGTRIPTTFFAELKQDINKLLAYLKDPDLAKSLLQNTSENKPKPKP